jgi:hypothetical protein
VPTADDQVVAVARHLGQDLRGVALDDPAGHDRRMGKVANRRGDGGVLDPLSTVACLVRGPRTGETLAPPQFQTVTTVRVPEWSTAWRTAYSRAACPAGAPSTPTTMSGASELFMSHPYIPTCTSLVAHIVRSWPGSAAGVLGPLHSGTSGRNGFGIAMVSTRSVEVSLVACRTDLRAGGLDPNVSGTRRGQRVQVITRNSGPKPLADGNAPS